MLFLELLHTEMEVVGPYWKLGIPVVLIGDFGRWEILEVISALRNFSGGHGGKGVQS